MNAYVTEPPSLLEEPVLIHQNKQFWSLQIGGWIGYFFVVFVAIIRPQFADANFNLSAQLINLAGETLCGFVLSYFQWRLIGKIVHLPLKRTLLLSFASAAVLGVVYNIFKLSCYKVIVYGQRWNEAWNMLEFGGWLLFSLTTMFAWTSIYFIMLYNNKLQKEHEMLLRAQTQAKEAQLQMLRYQLNPHFMFNTMNAISTLIYKKDNEKAGEMLDQLCSFFRYSLIQNTQQKSTFAKELELLELYLSIEKVRFGDKLNVTLDVDSNTLAAQVPTLFLQPIIENAIKYGIEARKQQGTIVISAKLVDKTLEITVFNEGSEQNEEQESGFGIGLMNTKERLKTMFNKPSTLKVKQTSTGTYVNIEVPYVGGT
ncbi:MAG: histidine kinase [Colwelliaceae bacterium]|nr:histidine kinase [Colwelliaceae bacterium]